MNEAAIAAVTQRFRFDRFDASGEEWEYYIQRFETELALHNLLAGDATAEARRNLLLSKIGPDAFKVLVDHFRPDAVTSKTYAQLKDILRKHYRKDTCILAERVKFTMRHRKDGETVSQFLIALRAIAGNCDFGESLNERLRDQLTIGINDDFWQQELFRLHTTNDTTLQQVEASALILEQASTQQKQIRSMAKGEQATEPLQVHRVKGTSQTPKVKQKRTPKELDDSIDCLRCGFRKHGRGENCAAKGSTCNACGGPNHFARVCLKTGNASVIHRREKHTRKLNTVGHGSSTDGPEESDIDDIDSDINVVHVRALKGLSARLTITINKHRVKMLYDPGAARSIINEHIWKRIGSPALQPTVPLVAYTNVTVNTRGEAVVKVKAFGKELKLPVIVINQQDTPLFGLDWCVAFGIKMPDGVTIRNIKSKDSTGAVDSQKDTNLKMLLTEFDELFGEDTTTITGHKAVVHLKDGAVPKIFPARPVPFPLRKAVETEIERLIKEDILEAVDTTVTPIEWASPIVCVPKPNGKIRLCVDFKATINQHVYVDPHPLPRFEDIVSKLGGSEYFSKIDLKDAFLQMEVDVPSRKYLVVATHMGYFRYKRLPFGVCFAPAVFQKTMDTILAGIPKTAAYIDDIVVAGQSKEEHLELLRTVFTRLKQANIRAKLSKCEFLKTEVTYLGYRIDRQGIHPTEEHIEALRNMPAPSNKKELRSFLGAINYYSRFIPNLQPMCAPLHSLTKDSVPWHWSTTSNNIYQNLKQILSSKDTLVHYNEDLPLVLVTDASNQGVGAVLLHTLHNGTERPVAYASRTFNDREKQYSVLDKEALAIIFGVTKFYQYVYGRNFTLRTDHKPLERILGAKREIPKMAANRLQRWALTLCAFDYDIQYVKGKENILADPLSRLPLKSAVAQAEEQSSYSLLNIRLQDLPLTRRELRKQTASDAVLSQIIKYVERGWPIDKRLIPSGLCTFYEKRDTLSFEEGILLWQGRIIIPDIFRKTVLSMLHDGHPGIWAMRALARFYVWWPSIDKEVEEFVKKCSACQQNRPREPETLLYSWCAPTEPWSRIHVDYAGPFDGCFWLVAIDAFSKWLEIKPQTSTTSAITIKSLREMFSRFGLPKMIVSDNGPQFSSQEFREFCESNNVIHVRTTPYHPKSNGLAERAVRTFKERYKAARANKTDADLALQRFLISYRNTPQKSTGRAPAEILLGRKLRTKLDLLKPDTARQIDYSLMKQKIYHDKRSKPRCFDEGELVWVQRTQGKGYDEGYIEKKTNDHSYLVKSCGKIQRKHADQLRVRELPEEDLIKQNGNLHTSQNTFVEEQHLNIHTAPYTHTKSSQVVGAQDAEEDVVSGDEGMGTPMLEVGTEGEHVRDLDDTDNGGETVDGSGTRLSGAERPPGDGWQPGDSTAGSSSSNRWPKRSRRAPVRPYDKYLNNPRAQ